MDTDVKSLLDAALEGHLDRVKELLENGTPANTRGNYYNATGVTALALAAQKGHIDIVRELIVYGARANIKYKFNDNGRESHALCHIPDNVEILHLLIIASGDIHDPNILPSIVIRNCIKVLRELIALGVDIHVKIDYFNNVFLVANTVEMIEELLAHGFDVNSVDRDRYTLLMWAAQKGRLDLVRCLLKNGADVNMKSDLCRTALSMAAKNDHKNVVNVLFCHKYEYVTDILNEDVLCVISQYMSDFEEPQCCIM
jgi:ankyrin repeat protein